MIFVCQGCDSSSYAPSHHLFNTMSPDDDTPARRPISVHDLNKLHDIQAKYDYVHNHYCLIYDELYDELAKLEATEERLKSELPKRQIKKNDEQRTKILADLSKIKEWKAEIEEQRRLIEASREDLSNEESEAYAEHVMMPSFVWH